jgi:CRP-like cAMP-binding protein
VTANKDCTLLQLSRKHFENIMAQSPELAARFLLAMNRFLGGRLRSTNDRFSKAQHFARGAAGQITAPGAMQWKKTH